MTTTFNGSAMRLICMRSTYLIAVVLSVLFLPGCMPAMVLNMNPTPTVDRLPEVKNIPLHAGVYYSAQFASFDQVRRKGNATTHVHIGAASVAYFEQLLPRVFEKTSRVANLLPDELRTKAVDLVIAPSLEYFDFPLGLEPYSERYGVAYRITLYTPQGVPVSSWVVYGTADHWKMIGGHIEAYMQQAATKFLETFEQESASGRAAIVSLRQHAPDPIDVASLHLSAQHTEPFSIAQHDREALHKAGFVFVEVSGTAQNSRAITVRASDMHLRLKDGRVIDACPPSALLTIAGADAVTPLLHGVNPLVGLALNLGIEARVSSASDDQRASLTNSVAGSEYFGDRILRADKGPDGGVVFFRLPAGGSAEGAFVTAWAVEPATAAGSQVEIPLLGAMTTR